MKKQLLLLSFVVAGSVSLSAQQPVTTVAQRNIATSGIGNPSVQNYFDTIDTYLLRATAYYTLTAGSSGYVLGSSNITTETGCHYSTVGNARVTELMIYFGGKTIMGNADMLRGNVYAVGTDSMPTTSLASGQVSMSNADTSGFPTFIPITNPAFHNGDFFVSVEYGTIDDSIMIMSTNPLAANGGPDGAGEKRCRQNTSLGWLRAADIWTIGGNAYNADALILPIVEVQTGIENTVAMNGFTLQAAYPSPATDVVNFSFGITTGQEVNLVVYNQLGQTVAEQNLGQLATGKHTHQLSSTELPAGNYYFVLSGEQGRIGSKFTVSK